MMDNGENTSGEISETGTDNTQETNEGLSTSLYDAAPSPETNETNEIKETNEEGVHPAASEVESSERDAAKVDGQNSEDGLSHSFYEPPENNDQQDDESPGHVSTPMNDSEGVASTAPEYSDVETEESEGDDTAEIPEGSSAATSSHEIGLSHSLYKEERDSGTTDTSETATEGNCSLTQKSLSVEITSPMGSGIKIEGTRSYTGNAEHCEQSSDAQGSLALSVSGRWSLNTELEEEKKRTTGDSCNPSTAT